MSDDGDTQRVIGQLEGRMSAIEKRVAEIHADTKAMRATLNQAKGGWRTLVVTGAIAGAVGALIGKFIPFIR